MATTARTRKPATRKPATRKPTAAQQAKTDAKAEAAAAARKAKTDAMAVVEEFDIDDASPAVVRAFEDLCTHYSEGNALLILAQAAEMGLKVRGLRDVGGFQTMQERGRAIRKGEHQVFFIWGRKIDRTNKSDADPVTPAPVATETAAQANERKARSFYPIVGLFHISQTEDLEVAKARWAAEKAAKSA